MAHGSTNVDSAAAAKPSGRQKALGVAQKLGRSLMLPIAALPVAGLMLRLGQSDLLGRFDNTIMQWIATIFGAAGGALFSNLPMLFAIGVAIGWARKADGSTALAAMIGYLVLSKILEAVSPFVLDGVTDQNGDPAVINYGVFVGLLAGVVSAILWEKYHRTRLPEWLGFFNGRRFVPMVVGFWMCIIAVPLAFIYPLFSKMLLAASDWVAENAVLGGGIFGVVNRLLIPVGLHHLINFTPWFVIGEFTNADGEVVHGDIARFLAHDPTAGTFMTGFFPIMMFALPAAALAITTAARKEQRKVVGGGMISLALTALITGITEPIEFAFMFVAWPLYIVHALLTGSSLAIANALDVHYGFTFSAGLTDYILNFGIAQKPLLIIVMGLVYAVIYYFIFLGLIRALDLKTPGRNPEEDQKVEAELTKD